MFHAGKPVQRGSYDALVNDKSGMYCKRWNVQAQYHVLRGGRTGGIFLRDGGSGSACPGFPCTFSGWEFLSRMA